MIRSRLLCLLAALLAFPTLALAQDNDGDTFETTDGDCDDTNPLAYPGSVETCDGEDNDCDGETDEAGATPVNCDTAPIEVAPFSNGPDGHLIVHVEKFVDAVDFTGINMWTSVQAGQFDAGGPETNVQSIFVRNWMGTSSSNVIANARFTFPPEVTLVGWVIDYATNGPINRGLDSTFSTVPGGLQPSVSNVQFEGTAQDYAWIAGDQALFHSYIATAADEARLIVSYDPEVVHDLTFEIEMLTGNIQSLYVCEADLGQNSPFDVPLTQIDDETFDDDGDGVTECDGDCDDDNATVSPNEPEICDGLDNDCDGILPTDELDVDSDLMTECEGDCDDGDDTIYDGAPELCDDLDNDCDGGLGGDEIDNDSDTITECDGDCDDTNTNIFPGAGEKVESRPRLMGPLVA